VKSSKTLTFFDCLLELSELLFFRCAAAAELPPLPLELFVTRCLLHLQFLHLQFLQLQFSQSFFKQGKQGHKHLSIYLSHLQFLHLQFLQLQFLQSFFKQGKQGHEHFLYLLYLLLSQFLKFPINLYIGLIIKFFNYFTSFLCRPPRGFALGSTFQRASSGSRLSFGFSYTEERTGVKNFFQLDLNSKSGIRIKFLFFSFLIGISLAIGFENNGSFNIELLGIHLK